jgi:hypothetical protein
MPLAMSRPWKHPNSGVYWLRKGVPEDLRALVGKREEKRSLGTRDPIEAKRKHSDTSDCCSRYTGLVLAGSRNRNWTSVTRVLV